MNLPYLCFNPLHILNPGMRRTWFPCLRFDNTIEWEIYYDTYRISTVNLKNPSQIMSYIQKLNSVLPIKQKYNIPKD